MEKQINYPKNYSLLKDDEMIYLDGESWSYREHKWNDSSLYAISHTRAEMDNAAGILKVLGAAVSIGVGLTGKIRVAILTMFQIVAIGTKNIFTNGRWNKAFQFGFQDELHSNLYFTAYMSNNKILYYGSKWLYTN